MQQYVDMRFALTYRIDEKDKSYTTAGAVRIEINLPGTSAACTFFIAKCITRKCLTLKTRIMVMDYNIRNGRNLWKYQPIKKSFLNIFS